MAEADKLATGERIRIEETDALLVIDVQPTFMPGGGLAVAGGDEVVSVIRDVLMPKFSSPRRIATKDRHPRGHISLASSYVGRDVLSELKGAAWSRDMYKSSGMPRPEAKFTAHNVLHYLASIPGQTQVLWPDHAIAGTKEAELHLGLVRFRAEAAKSEDEFGYVLVKGTDPREDSYSGFKGNAGTPTELADVLRERGVQRIFCCGLALDYCVRYTAEDGKALGFEVVVIDDATRAVGFPKGSVAATTRSFVEKGIRLVQADQLVEGPGSPKRYQPEPRFGRRGN